MDIGDRVTRLIGGVMPEPMEVTNLDHQLGTVICGEYEFDMKTGMEIDDEKEWGPQYDKTGSYLKEILDALRYIRKRQRDALAQQAENEG